MHLPSGTTYEGEMKKIANILRSRVRGDLTYQYRGHGVLKSSN
jgi:hypothetical protein